MSSDTIIKTVQIDGAFGEGGGQIIRNSLALGAMTGRSVEIINIRARRTKPGLQPQHLTAVRAAASLCAAQLEGDAIGSTRIKFTPQAPVQPGNYRCDIGTAGATGLVLQTTLLPLLLSGETSRVFVTGGTHVPHAPTLDYLQEVYLPALRHFGLHASIDYTSAGFFPKGGGKVEARIEASTPLEAIVLPERGSLTNLKAILLTSNLPEHVAERGAATIEKYMKGVGRKITVERKNLSSSGAGAAALIVAECEGGFAGFTSIGERGKPMEKVALAPCEEFMDWWKTGAACDPHLADQFVLPAALAKGQSHWTTSEVTEHLRTALWLAQQFDLIDYTVEERSGSPALVTVTPRCAYTR